jgi:hypothetical protein
MRYPIMTLSALKLPRASGLPTMWAFEYLVSVALFEEGSFCKEIL